MNDVIFLVTEDVQHIGTSTVIDYNGIFIKSDDTKYLDVLNPTEIDVFETIADDIDKNIKVKGIRCGCVFGYLSDMFSDNDNQLFQKFGLNKRFQF